MIDITGKRIRERRKILNLTQEELGAKIGVTKATINKYETSVVLNLKRPTIEKLAEILSVSPCYLMGWDNNPTLNNVHTNNGMIGNNSGAVNISNNERNLSREEEELLRIYNSLDVRGRIALLTTAIKLEDNE